MANVQDSDLIATGAGKGAAMVGFKQSGTGAVNRTALVKLQECVSVRDFGALGDGTTDDTAAIQAAIDSRGATGHLLIPEGTYRITDTLEIKPTVEWTGIHLFGRGPASKIVWDGGNNKPMIHIRGDGTIGLGFNSKSIIENFQLFGESFSGYEVEGYEIPADEFYGVAGIQIGDSTTPTDMYWGVCNLTIRSMLIRNIGTGILGYYESDEISICENHIKLFSNYGIRNYHGGSAWWVYRNHVSDGAEAATGIRMSLVSCVVEGNTIQGNGYSVSIQVDGGGEQGRAVSVCNNYLESGLFGDYGIIFYGVDTGVIENNSFQGFNGSKLIVLADSDGQSCRNITIGANRHSVSAGDILALVDATAGSTNCQITGKQETVIVSSATGLITGEGSIKTITGPFVFKNFDGVAELSQGIRFPATQNPSANPNTLDDYEEGSVTLGIKVGGTAQTTTSVARYTKVGRLVTIEGYVAMAAAVTGTGGVSVTGLPFSAAGYSAASVSLGNVRHDGSPSLLLISGTELFLMQTAGGSGTRSAVPHNYLASNSEIELALTYTVVA
jgi:hypothetical protein